ATSARLATRAAAFAALVPAWRDRITSIAGTLTSRLGSARSRHLRPIHHDFHGDNVLVDGPRLGLVDFEDCALGDPADDVGSMWAQLTWLARKAGGRSAPLIVGRQAFLTAYLGDAGGTSATRVAT